MIDDETEPVAVNEVERDGTSYRVMTFIGETDGERVDGIQVRDPDDVPVVAVEVRPDAVEELAADDPLEAVVNIVDGFADVDRQELAVEFLRVAYHLHPDWDVTNIIGGGGDD